MRGDILWLVIPCYNEQEVLPVTASRLGSIVNRLILDGKISRDSKIAFVNDGSSDRTWKIVETLCNQDHCYVGINLTRNEGHQNALLAGLMTARSYADAVISMDADLQDDVSVMEAFIDQYHGGSDIVYGIRSDRKTDSFLKRSTAQAFYKLMQWMGVELIYNHADYRLMSKRALDSLAEYNEVNLFLRGIIPQLGYKTSYVTYERKERAAGRSKYPIKKMLAFAIDGITSFTSRPIRMITNLGLLTFVGSILMLIYFLVRYFTGNTVSGWASLAVSIWALGGLQLLSIGIIGEYIAKGYMETKKRPKYFIERVIIHNTTE